MTAPGPTIIALDVDGTLFDGERVDAEAIAAVESAHRDGHVVLIVSGRPWRDLVEILADVLPSTTTAVCEHGALMVEVATGAVHYLAPAVSDSVRHELAAAKLSSMVVYEATIGLDASARPIADAVCGRPGSGCYVVGNKDSIAVVPVGCDKGTGLRRAVAALGLEGRPILAIGDATNDIPMFDLADVAVAVANAEPALLATGVEVTERGFGAGVADALRLHIPLTSEV